jgi:hypothetical protein
MASFSGQLKQMFRRLWRAPMFTFIAVFTLALAIGANTAIFSVLEGVSLKPLPYPDPDRLVGLGLTGRSLPVKDPLNLISPSIYFTYLEQSRTFESLGVYAGDIVSVTGIAEPEQVHALDVTYAFFPRWAHNPLWGVCFSPRTTRPDLPKPSSFPMAIGNSASAATLPSLATIFRLTANRGKSSA